MEVIKKTVHQAVTTGTTVTGGTIIIPDLSKIYYFKISLTQEARDLGFFEAYVSGTTVNVIDDAGGEFIPELPPTTPTGVPSVTTGTLGGSLHIRSIDNNVVNTDGGSLLQEYGILYTRDTNYSTPTTLIYENSPDFVLKSAFFVTTVPVLPKTYMRRIFPEEGTVYFRAYAKNANGIGYGAVVSGIIFIDGGDDLLRI